MRMIQRSRSGKWHWTDCLALSHDGPCECPDDLDSDQLDQYLLNDQKVVDSLLALRERLVS